MPGQFTKRFSHRREVAMVDEPISQPLRAAIEAARRTGSCDISNLRLTALPPEIVQLPSLRTLHLVGNQLTELPPEITQLTRLQTLTLNDNQLTELPPVI